MPPRVYLKILHITRRYNKINSRKKIIKTLTCSLCTIDECFTNIAVCEHARGTDIVPIFTCERVDAKKKKHNTLNTQSHTFWDMDIKAPMYGYVNRKSLYLHLLF